MDNGNNKSDSARASIAINIMLILGLVAFAAFIALMSFAFKFKYMASKYDDATVKKETNMSQKTLRTIVIVAAVVLALSIAGMLASGAIYFKS